MRRQGRAARDAAILRSRRERTPRWKRLRLNGTLCARGCVDGVPALLQSELSAMQSREGSTCRRSIRRQAPAARAARVDGREELKFLGVPSNTPSLPGWSNRRQIRSVERRAKLPGSAHAGRMPLARVRIGDSSAGRALALPWLRSAQGAAVAVSQDARVHDRARKAWSGEPRADRCEGHLGGHGTGHVDAIGQVSSMMIRAANRVLG